MSKAHRQGSLLTRFSYNTFCIVGPTFKSLPFYDDLDPVLPFIQKKYHNSQFLASQHYYFQIIS